MMIARWRPAGALRGIVLGLTLVLAAPVQADSDAAAGDESRSTSGFQYVVRAAFFTTLVSLAVVLVWAAWEPAEDVTRLSSATSRLDLALAGAADPVLRLPAAHDTRSLVVTHRPLRFDQPGSRRSPRRASPPPGGPGGRDALPGGKNAVSPSGRGLRPRHYHGFVPANTM